MKNAVSFIVYVILLLVLGAGIFFIYRYTNGFNEDFKTFYIERNGEKILTEKSGAEYAAGEEVRYDVGYTFDRPGSEPRDYSVTVLPNPEEDFDFEAGGMFYAWRLVEGLDEYFSLRQEADGFVFTVPEECSGMTDILGSVYGGEEISLAEVPSEAPFLLEVSSYNDAVRFVIAFSVKYASASEPDLREKYEIGYVVNEIGGAGFSTTAAKVDCVKQAFAGDEIEFTVTVDVGYEIVSVSAKDSVRLPAADVRFEDGHYGFTMPAKDVTLEIDIQRKYGG